MRTDDLVGDNKGYDGEHGLIDDLREHSLDESGSGTIEQSPEFNKDSEFIGESFYAKPDAMRPNGRLVIEEVPHEDIDEIRLAESIPCAEVKVQIIGVDGSIALARVEDVISYPETGDKFRVDINNKESPKIKDNKQIVTYLAGPIEPLILTTIEVMIERQGNTLKYKKSDVGIAPYENNTIKATVKNKKDANLAIVTPDLNSAPKPVVKTESYRQYHVQYDKGPTTGTIDAKIINQKLSKPMVSVIR